MKNKKYWLITSAVTLLPILVGLLLWDRLPAQLPTHFGIDGAADGFSGKGFAVFGLPVMMLGFHIVIWFATRLDKQNRGHNEKVLNLVGLIFPVISIVMSAFLYTRAMELELNLASVLFPLLGLFFLAMGNWLPKIRQNTTLGIKLKWTLYNEENWNRTHRFGGWCWVLGGAVFLVMGFVPAQVQLWLIPCQILLLVLAPMVYSWAYAKKQQKAGTWTESAVNQKLKKHPVILAVSMVLVVLILAGVAFVLFTGDIAYTCTDTALVIQADFWEDSTVPYDRIDSAEYRDTAPDGIRQWGFASAKLMMGWFDSDGLGGHTRYSYTGTDAHIVLRCGGEVLVLNAENETATRTLYEELMTKLRR